MPVPVTPNKANESGVTLPLSPPPSPESAQKGPADSSEISPDPSVVAGYKDCVREAIRFLLFEEGFPPNHPVIAGLALHLANDRSLATLNEVSNSFNSSTEETVTEADSPQPSYDVSSSTQEATEPTSTNPSITPLVSSNKGSQTVGYELTLEEVNSDDDEDDDDEMDYEDEEDQIANDILADPELRTKFIRLLYQGCNLYASPYSSISNTVTPPDSPTSSYPQPDSSSFDPDS